MILLTEKQKKALRKRARARAEEEVSRFSIWDLSPDKCTNASEKALYEFALAELQRGRRNCAKFNQCNLHATLEKEEKNS